MSLHDDSEEEEFFEVSEELESPVIAPSSLAVVHEEVRPWVPTEAASCHIVMSSQSVCSVAA